MLEHPWITKSYKIQTNAQLDREILSSLKGFDQKNLLQKEILFVMARISKENEIQKLKQAFKLIDKDNSGEIEYNCIPLIFERAGITPSSKEIDSLWNSLDFHQDGKSITLSSWLRLYHQRLSAKKKSFGLCFNISIETTLDISQVIL